MPVAKEHFVVGSTAAVFGYITDRSTGTETKVDLSGATITLYASLNGEAEEDFPAAADADQVTNRGKFTSTIPAAFFTDVGQAAFRVEALIAGLMYKSVKVYRKVLQ